MMFRNTARCQVVFSLAALAIVTTAHSSFAGTLSGAKSASRGEAPAESQSSSDDGQLSKARREARSSTRTPSHRDHDHDRGRHHHHRGHRPGPFFGFHIFRSDPAPVIVERHYVVPESIPQAPVEPFPQPTPPSKFFLAHPYEDDLDGYIFEGHHPDPGGNWSARLWLEGGFEVDNVERGSAGFLAQEIGGLGIDTHWNVYTEDLAGGGTDRLRIGDFNLHYRIAESEDIHWRIGVGVNWLSDTVATDYGINLTLGMDWFIAKPFVISTEVDWGTVGDAELFHGRVTAGVILDRIEVFGGYDYRTIGTVPLRGPVIGVRLWF